MVAAQFGAGQVAYSILWFFLFFVEIWLMLSVFIDVFRSHDLRGWAKAAWIIFVLAVPLLGILAYLIVRGDKMRAHQLHASPWREGVPGAPTSGPGYQRSVVEDLHRLAELRDRGDISADEYRRLKEHLLGDHGI
ncbi:MAG TPA: SHOCT domain-containing protein [Acidimicrobiales bacterium]|nr:SHOCT domain-containing protein [Acidimicrobiales bacterium]